MLPTSQQQQHKCHNFSHSETVQYDDDDEIYVLRRCHIVDDERQQDGLSISLQCGRPNVE